MRVLIFPIDMDNAITFARYALAVGAEVVAGSSALCGSPMPEVPQFVRLPYVTEPSFDTAFRETIHRYDISHVYAPHSAIWSRAYSLNQEDPESYPYHLCTPSPYVAVWQEFKDSYAWADSVANDSFVDVLADQLDISPAPQLSASHYAALHRQFRFIPGQCDDLKLQALAQICRVIPDGDFVEIGALYGRSSFALAWLAGRYGLGSLISVDPWDNDAIEDQGDKAALLNEEVRNGHAKIDFRYVFSVYLASVSLLDNVSYIKETSERAVAIYEAAVLSGSLSAKELGDVAITGEVSLLHIDGNHRYDFVSKDVEVWEPRVKSGGWILLDDYVWAFGDGPKLVGDEILGTGRFDVAFTMSDTLFLRKV